MISAQSFSESLVQGFAWAVASLVRTLFGSYGETFTAPLVYNLTWTDLFTVIVLLCLVVLVNGLLRRVFWRRRQRAEQEHQTQEWAPLLFEAARTPCYLFVWVYGLYLALLPLASRLAAAEGVFPFRSFMDGALHWGAFAALVWLSFRLIHVFEQRLGQWAQATGSRMDDLLVPLLSKSLKAVIPVIAIIFSLPLLNLPADYDAVLGKASSLLLIGTVSWVLCQAVILTEKSVIANFDLKEKDNLRARKIHTQVHVLKKTLLFVIGVFTAASVLMTFEEVRRFGTSILASAGVVGIIFGFAAQRTISNLFAGLQLALTQPIRLDDVVIVENEWGRIEEITLTYVVVRIWDLRRLIVPINYFIERPFQNWTRASSDILGAVTIWVDYTVPFEAIRQELKTIVEGCKDWDRKFWNMQVTDATDRTVQVRVLATAADASAAWNLRCEIREKLISFVQEKYPDSLPKVRAVLEPAAGIKVGEIPESQR